MSQKTTHRTIDLSPDKQIYESAAVDVSPIDAVEELIDNALDNWARVSNRVDDVMVEIEAKRGYTRVRDDTGGLDADDVRLLFALGATFQEDIAGSIGAYGIGAKKALVRLGNERVVKSRHRDADTGVGFRIDDEWLKQEGWEVELEEFDELDSGFTELEVHSDDEIWGGDRIDTLRQSLKQTYAKFLQGDIPQGGSVSISLNGSQVTPPEEPDWAFIPFDGLHPRRYSSIELRPKGFEKPVYMDVTVGHRRSQQAETGGTAVYMQDRLVTANETEEVGGFGSVGEGRIGNFTDHNSRLKVIVELHTDGDSSELPWDAQKGSLDPYHPVSRVMYDWLRRIVRPYFKADAGKVPVVLIKPYTADHEYAANGGELEILDYSDRSKVMHGPDEGFPTVMEIKQRGKAHAEQGFILNDAFEPPTQVAYEEFVRDQAADPEHLTRKDELGETDRDPVQDEERAASLTSLIHRVERAGAATEEALVESGYTTVEELREASVDQLVAIDGIGQALAERIVKTVSEEAEPSDENQDDRSDVNEGSPSDQSQRSEKDNEEDDLSTKNDGEPSGTEDPMDPSSEQHQYVFTAEDELVVIPLRMDQEEFEVLRRALGRDDADPEELGEELSPRVRSMFAPASHSE